MLDYWERQPYFQHGSALSSERRWRSYSSDGFYLFDHRAGRNTTSLVYWLLRGWVEWTASVVDGQRSVAGRIKTKWTKTAPRTSNRTALALGLLPPKVSSCAEALSHSQIANNNNTLFGWAFQWLDNDCILIEQDPPSLPTPSPPRSVSFPFPYFPFPTLSHPVP